MAKQPHSDLGEETAAAMRQAMREADERPAETPAAAAAAAEAGEPDPLTGGGAIDMEKTLEKFETPHDHRFDAAPVIHPADDQPFRLLRQGRVVGGARGQGDVIGDEVAEARRESLDQRPALLAVELPAGDVVAAAGVRISLVGGWCHKQ